MTDAAVTDVMRDGGETALVTAASGAEAGDMVAPSVSPRRLEAPSGPAGWARRAYQYGVMDDWDPRRWTRARVGGVAFLGFLLRPVQVTLASDWSVAGKVWVLVALAAFAACFVTVFWRNTPTLHANRAPWAIVGALALGVPLVVVFGATFLGALTTSR